jgi:deazaflavin-dependent oxidoreductase (nitroreductase family)
MVRTYRLSFGRRLINGLVRGLLRIGLAPPGTYLLSVRGRRSGQVYSTPVTLIENDERWLVAPYGDVSWVKNARASGEVTLSRGRRRETLRLREASPEEAAPVLREYVRKVRVVRPFFDATPDSPLENFGAEADRHPVFQLEAAAAHP